jgi:mono/diheme cytochrome c family protein
MPTRTRTALLPLLLVAAAIGLGACSTTDDDGEDLDQATEEARSTPAPADAEQPLTPATERGRTLFVETCGACHTLDAAGTQGAIGPNLDELQADRERVLRAIERGGTGSGSMPAGLYEGKDAQDVAEFVADSGPGV